MLQQHSRSHRGARFKQHCVRFAPHDDTLSNDDFRENDFLAYHAVLPTTALQSRASLGS